MENQKFATKQSIFPSKQEKKNQTKTISQTVSDEFVHRKSSLDSTEVMCMKNDAAVQKYE